jgi:hypothetical protein
MEYKCKKAGVMLIKNDDEDFIIVNELDKPGQTAIPLDELNEALDVLGLRPPKEPDVLSVISNTTRIGLGYMDRLRVAFGAEIKVSIEIEVNRWVKVLKSTGKTTIQPFFNPKPSKANFAQSPIEKSK